VQLIEHWPIEHDGVPLFELQAWLHAPQLAALVRRLTSQPFAGFPSQSP
jgi:hypothetical protein